jgi:hypothetical protein
MTEVRLHTGLQILARAKVNHVRNLHVLKALRHACHGTLEHNRLADRVPKNNPVAVFYHGNRLFRRHGMLFIIFSPVHIGPPSA